MSDCKHIWTSKATEVVDGVEYADCLDCDWRIPVHAEGNTPLPPYPRDEAATGTAVANLGAAYDLVRVQSSGGGLEWDDWWEALAHWFWATREALQATTYGRALTEPETRALAAARVLIRRAKG